MSKDLEKFFNSQLDEHIKVVNFCKNDLQNSFINAVDICYYSLKKKKKILFFGNGGSAADAQHLATELTVRFSKNRQAIPAISLVTDTSALTAIGNDFGFDFIFSRQIEALGEKDDVVIGITTSGKSKNVINAIKTAKKKGLKCIAFTGNYTRLVSGLSDEIISVPALNTSRIQEMHILIGQMLCNALEYKLGYAHLVKEEK
jgi:D-sedoheptulose 7-phosphate isomerase